MKRIVCLLLILAIHSGIQPGTAAAASLWVDGTNLVGDKKPGKVGDIVTVLVREKYEDEGQGEDERHEDQRQLRQ